jgi:Spy/CpxP family protein refolding chaperone
LKPIVKFITFGAICAGLALAQHTPPNPATMVQYRVQHLTKVLTLTTAQQTQATTIFTTAETANQAVMASLKENRTSLNAAIKGNDTGAISTLTAQIGTFEGQMTANNATADAAFYAILTPAQQAKYTPGMGGLGGHAGGPRFRGGPQQ